MPEPKPSMLRPPPGPDVHIIDKRDVPAPQHRILLHHSSRTWIVLSVPYQSILHMFARKETSIFTTNFQMFLITPPFQMQKYSFYFNIFQFNLKGSRRNNPAIKIKSFCNFMCQPGSHVIVAAFVIQHAFVAAAFALSVVAFAVVACAFVVQQLLHFLVTFVMNACWIFLSHFYLSTYSNWTSIL